MKPHPEPKTHQIPAALDVGAVDSNHCGDRLAHDTCDVASSQTPGAPGDAGAPAFWELELVVVCGEDYIRARRHGHAERWFMPGDVVRSSDMMRVR